MTTTLAPMVQVKLDQAVHAVENAVRADTQAQIADTLQHLLNWELDLANVGKPSNLSEQVSALVASLRNSSAQYRQMAERDTN